MTQKTLMILAGYPSSGKSVMLQHAARDRTPLFGPQFASEFEAAVAPGEHDEEVSTSVKLKARTWTSLTDYPTLAKMEKDALPDQLVFRLDLLLFALATLRPKAVSDIITRPLDGVFARFLSEPFASHYDVIAVNTLVPEYEFIARNWRDHFATITDRKQRVVAMKNRVMSEIDHPEQVYSQVCRAWLDAAADKAASIVVSERNEQAEWRITTPPKKAANGADTPTVD